ncbi:MAG: 30S ribosomal protein S17 [Kiritimatiellaeota bacterium]|nr:30S ribosomal protein S17 [Kiritimatiellota bacterium]
MTDENTQAKARGIRKTRQGVVTSKSGEKTIVVEAERRYHHPLYGKTLRDHRKFHAHDEENKAKVGDVVTIEETRPISRLKRWRLVAIVETQP